MADSTEELRFRAVGEDAGAGRMMDRLAKGADTADGSIKQINKDLATFDKQISETESHVRGLISQLAETGDQTLLKDIRKDRAQLNMLSYLRQQLAGEMGKAGTEAGGMFNKSMITTLAALPKAAGTVVTPVLAGLAVLAAPMIGATVGAAVLGGVGAGGIIGAVALAAQDPRVEAAGERMAESLLGDFRDAAEPAVVPLLDAIGRLTNTGSTFAGRLTDDFASLSRLLKPITEGIDGFADNIDPGLSAAFKASEPIIRLVANELPDLGDAVSDALESISEEGDGAAIALSAILDTTEDVIRDGGEFIAWLSAAYEGLVRFQVEAAGFAENLVGWVPLTGQLWTNAREDAQAALDAMEQGKDTSNDFAGSLYGVANAAEEAAEKAKDLDDAFNDVFGKEMDLKEATLRYEEGIRRVGKELAEGTRTLDINTEAGRQNLGALNDQVQKIEALRDAQFRQNGDLAAANATYDKHIAQLKNVMRQLGFNEKATNDYFRALENIPEQVRTKLIIEEFYRSGEVKSLERRALGGPTKSGRTYLVGENGPELWVENGDGHMYNAAQTKSMMSGATGGSYAPAGGVDGVQVLVSAAPGAQQALAQMLLEMLRFEVRGFESLDQALSVSNR